MRYRGCPWQGRDPLRSLRRCVGTRRCALLELKHKHDALLRPDASAPCCAAHIALAAVGGEGARLRLSPAAPPRGLGPRLCPSWRSSWQAQGASPGEVRREGDVFHTLPLSLRPGRWWAGEPDPAHQLVYTEHAQEAIVCSSLCLPAPSRRKRMRTAHCPDRCRAPAAASPGGEPCASTLVGPVTLSPKHKSHMQGSAPPTPPSVWLLNMDLPQ